jgi:hypothetical protein
MLDVLGLMTRFSG